MIKRIRAIAANNPCTIARAVGAVFRVKCKYATVRPPIAAMAKSTAATVNILASFFNGLKLRIIIT